MTDLLSFIGAPVATPTALSSLDGASTGAPGDAFAALLDDVLNQLAVVTSAMPQPTMADLDATGTVAGNAADTTPRTATGEVPADETEAPVARSTDEAVDVIAASVARVALGLSTPAPIAMPMAATGAEHRAPVAAAESSPSDQHTPTGVAVGRTGEMPTLPAQAHAVLPMPAGIARRFPAPATTPAPAPAIPTPEPIPAPVDLASPAPVAAPVDARTDTPVSAPIATPLDARISAPVSASPDAPVTAPEPPAAPDAAVAPVADTTPDVPRAPSGTEATAGEPVTAAESALAPTSTPTTEPAPIDPAPNASAPAGAPVPAAAVHATAAASIAAPPTAPRTVEREHIHGVGAPLRAALREMPTDRENTLAFTVRLDPPELGAVRVRVVAHGERVHVTLHAESPEARAALQERHHDVAELLRNDGFNLENFDVESHEPERRHDEPARTRRDQAFDEPETPDEDNELRL
jgi:flagellar hook-length control protein FliK